MPETEYDKGHSKWGQTLRFKILAAATKRRKTITEYLQGGAIRRKHIAQELIYDELEAKQMALYQYESQLKSEEKNKGGGR